MRSTATAVTSLSPETLAGGEGFLPIGPHALAEGLRPPADDIPKKESDLRYRVSQIHELTVTAAGELDIPIAGGISGGQERRVVVSERVAYSRIAVGDDTWHYGWAIRLAITVSRRDSTVKLALPFIAAAAEMGEIEGRWSLQVVGLSGPRINEGMLPPTKLNVETFVLAQQSLEKLIAAVGHSSTQFHAEPIAIETSAARLEQGYIRSALRTYALGCIERGRSLDDALRGLRAPTEATRAIVGDTYRQFAGLERPSVLPTEDDRRRAGRIMAMTR